MKAAAAWNAGMKTGSRKKKEKLQGKGELKGTTYLISPDCVPDWLLPQIPKGGDYSFIGFLVG
jgi:hypothetical protein